MVYFIAIDGDNIGNQIMRFIIENKKNKLKSFSEEVKIYFNDLMKIYKDLGAEIIFCGGDSLLIQVNQDYNKYLNQTIKPLNDFTVSIGIGKNLSETYISLRYAKAAGKDQTVIYNQILKNSNSN